MRVEHLALLALVVLGDDAPDEVLLAVSFLIWCGARRRIPRPLPQTTRRKILDFSESECIAFFRFSRPDLQRLHVCLQYPATIQSASGFVFSQRRHFLYVPLGGHGASVWVKRGPTFLHFFLVHFLYL